MMPEESPPLVHGRGQLRDGGRGPGAPGWLDLVVRAGYVAKAVLYLGIGIAAAFVALGWSEQARGSHGAMYAIAALPMGRVLMGVLVVGLVSYAVLSLVAAVRDPERNGGGVSGLAVRTADAITGIAYAGLAAAAVRLLAEPSYRAAPVAELWATRVMTLPAGAFAVGLAGLGLVGSGLALFAKAGSPALGSRLDRRGLSARARRWVIRLGRAGAVARGLVFCVCGAFLLAAAIQRDPTKVRDVGEALTALGRRSYGPAALAVLAVGFLAYGVFQLAKARYRRLRV
jgi:hypothetical protein